MRRPSRIGLAALVLALAGPSPAHADPPPSLERYEARLAANPEDFDALLGAAAALVRHMAARTNGNLPLVDGLQDSDENRALWAELGPKALTYARKASELRPDSVEAAFVLANAYMFYSSSLGIISAILQGAATEYGEHVRRLIALDPSYDDGAGDYLLASYYLVAPWPLGDSDEALAHFETAARLSPESVRNHYGLAVYWAREGNAERARSHFDRVLSLPCTANNEQLFCDFMKRESKRARDGL